MLWSKDKYTYDRPWLSGEARIKNMQECMAIGERLMREYETGATRDNCDDKPDYEGFLSPLVIVEFGKYMHKHRKQADGKLRDSDNWQKGMPLADYMKSMYRHFIDVWLHHRGFARIARESLKEALCALIFNAQGYLHELLKKEMQEKPVTLNAFMGNEIKKEATCPGCEAIENWLHPTIRPEEFDKLYNGDWCKTQIPEGSEKEFEGLTDQEQSREEQKKQDTYRPGCDCIMCRKSRKEKW